MLKNNIDNELRNMLKIDDDEDLMSLALNELDISEKSFNFDDDKNLMTVDNSIQDAIIIFGKYPPFEN